MSIPEEILRRNSEAPQTVKNNETLVQQHDLDKQIEMDRYLSSKEAVKTPTRGLRFNKIVPPGSV